MLQLAVKSGTLFYWDRALSMGLAVACNIFSFFAAALLDILKAEQVPHTACDNLLDDFFLAGANEAACKMLLNKFMGICKTLNVPIAERKTEGPACIITYLGMMLDTLKMEARLPPEKLEDCKRLVKEMCIKRTVTRRELESLVGKLSFACAVIPARAFLRRLIDKVWSVELPSHYIGISREMREDLLMWYRFLIQYNGVTMFRCGNLSAIDLHMTSDASKRGFGAHFNNNWVQAPFPSDWGSFHISILELYPVLVLFAMFGRDMANKNVLFHTDNMEVVSMVNKQTSNRKIAMIFIRELVFILAKNNTQLRCAHIPGVDNTLADKISRFQVNPSSMVNIYGMNPYPTQIPRQWLPANFENKWLSTWKKVLADPRNNSIINMPGSS